MERAYMSNMFNKLVVLDPSGAYDGFFKVCHPHADIIIKSNTQFVEAVKGDNKLKEADWDKWQEELRLSRWDRCGKCGNDLKKERWLFMFVSENNKMRLMFVNDGFCARSNLIYYLTRKEADRAQVTFDKLV